MALECFDILFDFCFAAFLTEPHFNCPLCIPMAVGGEERLYKWNGHWYGFLSFPSVLIKLQFPSIYHPDPHLHVSRKHHVPNKKPGDLNQSRIKDVSIVTNRGGRKSGLSSWNHIDPLKQREVLEKIWSWAVLPQVEKVPYKTELEVT